MVKYLRGEVSLSGQQVAASTAQALLVCDMPPYASLSPLQGEFVPMSMFTCRGWFNWRWRLRADTDDDRQLGLLDLLTRIYLLPYRTNALFPRFGGQFETLFHAHLHAGAVIRHVEQNWPLTTHRLVSSFTSNSNLVIRYLRTMNKTLVFTLQYLISIFELSLQSIHILTILITCA